MSHEKFTCEEKALTFWELSHAAHHEDSTDYLARLILVVMLVGWSLV